MTSKQAEALKWLKQHHENTPPTWSYERCWIPRYCKRSKKILWLSKHFKVTTIHTGNYGNFFIEQIEWIHREAGMTIRLTGDL